MLYGAINGQEGSLFMHVEVSSELRVASFWSKKVLRNNPIATKFKPPFSPPAPRTAAAAAIAIILEVVRLLVRA